MPNVRDTLDKLAALPVAIAAVITLEPHNGTLYLVDEHTENNAPCVVYPTASLAISV